jgi:hypothetical protein
MDLPSPIEVTNQYLYGQTTVPDSIIGSNRPAGETSTIQLDASQYMTTGAGRFAVGAQFSLVQDFFNNGITLSPGTYTKSQLHDARTTDAVWSTSNSGLPFWMLKNDVANNSDAKALFNNRGF